MGLTEQQKILSDNARDFVFTPAEVTKTNEIENLASIKFSPNPSNGSTVLSYDLQQFENLVLTVTNIKGRIVFTDAMDNSQTSYVLETK